MKSDISRSNSIYRHPVYVESIRKVEKYEADRIFCCHQMNHFMDVARIAYILDLEENLDLSPDLIYAAALLHDIGRYVQYEDGTPHEIASGRIAPGILRDCGYSEQEIEVINEAIFAHRDWERAQKNPLSSIIYRADKASRACYSCKAEKLCDWKKDKKNPNIVY